MLGSLRLHVFQTCIAAGISVKDAREASNEAGELFADHPVGDESDRAIVTWLTATILRAKGEIE